MKYKALFSILSLKYAQTIMPSFTQFNYHYIILRRQSDYASHLNYKKLISQPYQMQTSQDAAVEGWILIITNLHEEIQEDDLFDAFSKYGQIKSMHLNLDRKTGYAKGYALIQFSNFQEASSALKEMNREEILDKRLKVDWAFQEKPLFQKKKAK